jgi:hypothetical protein
MELLAPLELRAGGDHVFQYGPAQVGNVFRFANRSLGFSLCGDNDL